MRGARRRRGFTLIELLVAVFITAILFAIGYTALDQALRSRVVVEERSARLVAVQRAMRVLEQDFELLQPRPVRDPLGGSYLPALASGAPAATASPAGGAALTGALVSFTRGGWSNPAGVQRSELQRVAYLVQDHRLVRAYWNVLDPIAGAEPVQRTLLDGVESLSLRYMDDGHQWQTAWPEASLGGTQTLAILRRRPVAVEVTLVLQDWGTLVRVIEVAG